MCWHWHPYICRLMHQNIIGSTVSHCILVHKPLNSGIWICPVDQLSFKYEYGPTAAPIWHANFVRLRTQRKKYKFIVVLELFVKSMFSICSTSFFNQKLINMMIFDYICKNVYVVNTNSGDFLRATTTTLYIYGYIHRSKHPPCSSAK